MKYKVIYLDRKIEMLNLDKAEDLIYDLETFERDDISMILAVSANGKEETIWTEEEGLFVSIGKLLK